MSNGEIYARIMQMREAASTIGTSASRIRGCMESVENEIQALGTDRFTSAGAEAFRAEYNRLTPRLKQAFENILRFQNKLNTSADDIEVASRSTE